MIPDFSKGLRGRAGGISEIEDIRYGEARDTDLYSEWAPWTHRHVLQEWAAHGKLGWDYFLSRDP